MDPLGFPYLFQMAKLPLSKPLYFPFPSFFAEHKGKSNINSAVMQANRLMGGFCGKKLIVLVISSLGLIGNIHCFLKFLF